MFLIAAVIYDIKSDLVARNIDSRTILFKQAAYHSPLFGTKNLSGHQIIHFNGLVDINLRQFCLTNSINCYLCHFRLFLCKGKTNDFPPFAYFYSKYLLTVPKMIAVY